MDAFGINWNYLFFHAAASLAVFLLFAVIIYSVKYKQPSRFFVAILGLLTAWVTLYIAVYLVLWAVTFIFSFTDQSFTFEHVFSFYDKAGPISLLTVLLGGLLAIYYLLHVMESPMLSRKERGTYVFGLLVLPLIIMPIYYFRFLLKSKITVS